MSTENKAVNVEVRKALVDFPYFVLKNEIKVGYSLYAKEILEIKQNYVDYAKGAIFYPEGSAGDYVPSNIRFKLAKTLIDKQARFMFSQMPDINIKALNSKEQEKQDQYQKLVRKVLNKCGFGRNLLKSAKDCFIGKRIACLVDFSEEDGIQVHFYNSLQFYYETDYDSKRITKFISFKQVSKSKSNSEKLYLVKKYVEQENGTISFSCILYAGNGKVQQVVFEEKELQLKYIPAIVVENDGILDDVDGVSEISDLIDYEAGYSRLSNADIDSGRKGMNPIRYTVDMHPRTTGSLPSGAGAYWDLQHNTNVNEPKPSVGTLAPAMNHTEAVKTTLERIKSTMYNEVDMPDISKDGLLSGITSFKALKALYYPLTVRCDEKMITWKPAIEAIIRAIIDLALLNKDKSIELYVLTDFEELQCDIEVVANYALVDDENEEKEIDLSEIAQNTRSRKSYIKKWRGSEFSSEEQIEQELMQIAIELNMFDTMSINTQVQTELDSKGTKQKVVQNIEEEEIEEI